METENKVFVSNIIRSKNTLKNNLKDISNIVPAVPIKNTLINTTINNCNFVPRSDKQYVPKKRITTKVKTVKDIRKVLESDVYTYLPADLERQKSLLLRKIRVGTTKDETTKELAKSILEAPAPISRSSWQMIMNINPEQYTFSSQYVLWNNKSIQVNGSKGGKNKFICKHDIAKVKCNTSQTMIKSEILPRKRSLLQNSLDVNFKPGPLSKKKRLDTSYQKYQFGDMNLVTLPKPGLDIQPSFGKPLAPAINTFIHHAFLLPAEGIISKNWADFSVSVVGTLKNGTPVQVTENYNISFDLDYKCFQRRILMRQDSDKEQQIKFNTDEYHDTEDELMVKSEVCTILNRILDSVEISLKQEDMYSGPDDPRDVADLNNTCYGSSINQIRDKGKRKFGELDRLDVTVITIEESSNTKNSITCLNAHCCLGCVCDSLKSSYIFKRHCGKIECMFKCKCDFSRYKITDSFDDCSDIIPDLINFDKKLGQTLAKEEHKFHQTVIVTNEKSILLKSQRRNWKTSKKYAEFYSNMQLRAIDRNKQNLSVVCKKLDLKNIEPWCMVHNLYKCFCKGRFTELYYSGALNVPNIMNVSNVIDKSEKNIESINLSNTTPINSIKASLRARPEPCTARDNKEISMSHTVSLPLEYTSSELYESLKCARTLCYEGRKYSEKYYQATNQKILDMERNDKKLHKKMIFLMKKCNASYPDGEDSRSVDYVNAPPSLNDLLNSVISQNSQGLAEDIGKPLEKIAPNMKRIPNKESLVSWLESNYKFYKDQTVVDPIKTGLHPPKYGKIALYPWNFILSRYRDRKNLFLISKQKPFRIFMAVNKRNAYFNNCIDISDIALSDLDKYPDTIKNLLTNATEAKDNFYILYGLSFCWELIGSVTKVNENIKEKENTIDSKKTNKRFKELEDVENMSDAQEISESNNISDSDCVIVPAANKKRHESEFIQFTNEEPEMSSNQSKWFLMTIENDFSEIQFFKKGFFVKYENLIKATTVAKRLGKTVRLSSQQCNTNNPQFGIYAIPSTQNNYVFIGPYEKDDSLGIETVKTKDDKKKAQCTRGTWITTNKIDNFKVIDNPLLYIPSSKVNDEKMMIAFDSNPKTICETRKASPSELTVNSLDDKHTQPNVSTEKSPRLLKPIRIRKSNNFRLGIIKQPLVMKKSLIINKSDSNQSVQKYSKIKSLSQICKTVIMPKKIAQEIASQNKACNIAIASAAQRRKHERGMFILKPEEINKRSLENGLSSISQPGFEDETNCESTMDIENFLSRTDIYVPPKTDVFVISDDEDDREINTKSWKEVWIVSKNIPNLGSIPGRQNVNNQLSFEFPGFTYTDFYAKEEAFNKINQ